MTLDTSQAVIIIDHNVDLHNEINHLHCMARKSDHKQCTNNKKIGDFCKMHSEKQNIIRIDEVFVIKSKRPYTKKLNQETNTHTMKNKIHFSDEIFVGTANFFHVDQPVLVGFAIAQRQQNRTAQTTGR